MILLSFLPIIITLALLRWFEMHMERGRAPLDTGSINFTRHYDRKPRDKTVPKITYDPIADAQLKRLQDRRRKIIPDSGERRRKSD